jgi:hypothetical protein
MATVTHAGQVVATLLASRRDHRSACQIDFTFSNSNGVCVRDLAARCTRGLHLRLPSSLLEGAGKTGCLLHPRSRVRFAQTKGHTSIQGSGSIPAFPAQWLYGLLRALPGERLFCLRRPREVLPLPDLAPAPRRPNHTTSPYASGAYVYRALSVHRISPRVRDDREAPLIRRETKGVVRLIWVRTKAEYF